MKYPLILAFSFLFGGCCIDPCVNSQFYPSARSEMTIEQEVLWHYLDGPNDSTYWLSAYASLHDKYGGRVRINDDTLGMVLGTYDTTNVVHYERGFKTEEASFRFDGSIWHLSVDGSTAFPRLVDSVRSPVRPAAIYPRVTDTLNSSGFAIRWAVVPEDSIRVEINDPVNLDTTIIDRGELRIGAERIGHYSPALDWIRITLTRSASKAIRLADSSMLTVRMNSRERFDVSYRQ